MDEKEQLEWCTREQATVWFGKDGVKVKVKDFTGSIKGKALEEAIKHIENFRQHRKDSGFER